MNKKDLIVESSSSSETWEDDVSLITSYMQKINPAGDWKARVKNFGWMNRDGVKEKFVSFCGGDLLSKILPKCDCSFKVYKYRKTGIAVNNAHHDSPMWAEWYYVLKV